MIHIRNFGDAHTLIDDPDIFREVFGFLSVCAAELVEYAGDEELVGYDFNFMIATDQDRQALEKLGIPEECARIDNLSGDSVNRLYRVVYPTEVFFIPGGLAAALSFPLPT